MSIIVLFERIERAALINAFYLYFNKLIFCIGRLGQTVNPPNLLR